MKVVKGSVPSGPGRRPRRAEGVREPSAQAPRAYPFKAAPVWTLPSGEPLPQFALRGGFMAPRLLPPGGFAARVSRESMGGRRGVPGQGSPVR